jgi:quercetin dioxygenase-like cupin family protein
MSTEPATIQSYTIKEAASLTGLPETTLRYYESRGQSMKITRNTNETALASSEQFTGTVFIDPLKTPEGQSRLQAASVHFTPGARTAWHSHPNGQTFYVTEGIGFVSHRGGALETIRPGDVVFIEPNEEHWHGASPNRFMTHIAMHEVDEAGNAVTWLTHVTDEEYNEGSLE